MKIDLNRITERQKLIIEKGLCDYCYIMKNRDKNDADFQSVYYDFYLRARWAVMQKRGNYEPYFKAMFSISPEDDLMEILEHLKQTMESHSYELSLGSKLLHTRNPLSPIYDSKVRTYLTLEEHVNFWRQVKGAPRGTSEKEKISHDWNALMAWYDMFMKSERGKSWVEWFDSSFPESKDISDVKKVDFIIFATN